MKRNARLIAVLGAATVAACFSKPGAPHVGEGDGDGGMNDDAGADDGMSGDPDARPDAFVSLPCPHDEFDDPSETYCGPWGNAMAMGTNGTITMTRQTDLLKMDFSAAGLSTWCTSNGPISISNGTSVYLSSPTPAGGVWFSIKNSGQTTKFVFQHYMANFSWLLDCEGVDAHTPMPTQIQPQWMQFKVANLGGSVLVTFETSTTGLAGSWTPFAQNCTYQVPYSPAAIVELGAESGSGAGSAYWDHFNIPNCPP